MDDPIPFHGRCRSEETILCRLHVGHTFQTHFYLLKGEEPSVCVPFNEVLSVEHIFTTCMDLHKYRNCFV